LIQFKLKFTNFKALPHQLANGTPSNAQVGSTQAITAAQNNAACSTVFHVGLGQYVSDQEHFKSLFTV
jgi:hypothetical protein